MDYPEQIKYIKEMQSSLLSMPHRLVRKRTPMIGNKPVPIHCIYSRKSYSLDVSGEKLPSSWAYVPFPPKRKKVSAGKIPSILESPPQETSLMNKTSELLLKKYLKRKQRLIYRDNVSLSSQDHENEETIHRFTSNSHKREPHTLSTLNVPEQTNAKAHLTLGSNQRHTIQSKALNRIGSLMDSIMDKTDNNIDDSDDRSRKERSLAKWRQMDLGRMEKTIRLIKSSVHVGETGEQLYFF